MEKCIYLYFTLMFCKTYSDLEGPNFPDDSNGKASAYNLGDPGSIPGSGWSREGNGNLLQYSCLEIPWTEEPGRL